MGGSACGRMQRVVSQAICVHYFTLTHLSIVCPLLPSRAKVGQTRGLDLIKCEIPQPPGNFSLQIPTPPPGLTKRIGFPAHKMKIAIVYTYSAD